MSPILPVTLPPIGITPKFKNIMSGSWEVDVRECQIDIDQVRSVYKCSLYKLHIARSLASMKLTQLQRAVVDFILFSACTSDTPVANGNLK